MSVGGGFSWLISLSVILKIFLEFILWFSGQGTISKLLKMTDEEDELAYSVSPGGAPHEPLAAAATSDSRPAWMQQLLDAASRWLQLLPQVLGFYRLDRYRDKFRIFRVWPCCAALWTTCAIRCIDFSNAKSTPGRDCWPKFARTCRTWC